MTPSGNAGAFVTLGETKMLLENSDGLIEDITRYGNELQEPCPDLLMAVAGDLNADGHVDLLAGNPRGASFFVTNRGYGSFMQDAKWARTPVFPAEVYNNGIKGIAVGDVTGDGANDLFVSRPDGMLTLLVNKSLDIRKTEREPATLNAELKQIQARIVTVQVNATRGATGSQLRVMHADGQLLTRRFIGTNSGIGCAGPHQSSIAIRDPGAYQFTLTLGTAGSCSAKSASSPSSPAPGAGPSLKRGQFCEALRRL